MQNSPSYVTASSILRPILQVLQDSRRVGTKRSRVEQSSFSVEEAFTQLRVLLETRHAALMPCADAIQRAVLPALLSNDSVMAWEFLEAFVAFFRAGAVSIVVEVVTDIASKQLAHHVFSSAEKLAALEHIVLCAFPFVGTAVQREFADVVHQVVIRSVSTDIDKIVALCRIVVALLLTCRPLPSSAVAAAAHILSFGVKSPALIVSKHHTVLRATLGALLHPPSIPLRTDVDEVEPPLWLSIGHAVTETASQPTSRQIHKMAQTDFDELPCRSVLSEPQPSLQVELRDPEPQVLPDKSPHVAEISPPESLRNQQLDESQQISRHDNKPIELADTHDSDIVIPPIIDSGDDS